MATVENGNSGVWGGLWTGCLSTSLGPLSSATAEFPPVDTPCSPHFLSLFLLPPLNDLPVQCLIFLCNLFLAQIRLSLHFPEAESNHAMGGSSPLAQISGSICEWMLLCVCTMVSIQLRTTCAHLLLEDGLLPRMHLWWPTGFGTG